MASATETEDVTSYRRAVIDVFVSYYDRIRNTLKGDMEDFASRVYAKRLISSPLMEFPSIFEQFKTGFESCGSISEIQQRYKCFIDILLDIGGPVGDVGKEIEEKLSNITVPCHSLQEGVPSIEPHPTQENTTDDQWQPHNKLLNDVLVKVDNAHDLKPKVEKLQSTFDLLVPEVKNVLIVNKVDLNDVKDLVISPKLHSIHPREEQEMAHYRQKLHGIRDMASLFKDFLLKYYFISYLNYVLLKDISKLTKDKSIASQFEDYEKLYVKLISTAKFRDIMSAFDQNPHLRITVPIGLPTVVFQLNNLWQDKTIFDFVSSCLWGFSSYELLLLKELREKCIIVTYAVFPSVLSDVLEYFKSSAVQQKFQEMGVSVELPEYTGENKVQKEDIVQILQNNSKALSKLTLPVEIVQTLYTEGIISKKTRDEVESSGGSLTDGPLRALSNTVSDDPNQLRLFSTVLLQSEETVRVANDILEEYDSMFPQSPPNQSIITKDSLSTFTLNTTSTTTQSDITELHTCQYSFVQMKVTFRDLIDTVTPLIAKSIPSLRILKEYLRRYFKEIEPQLDIARSFDDVMDILEKKCTIIDIYSFEATIEYYNIEEAKCYITDYKTVVDKFCEVVKLSVCVNENFIMVPSSLLKCETIEFALECQPDECSLDQIRNLLVTVFNDVAKRVQVRMIKKSNYITITCYAPRHIMDVLLVEAEKSLYLLKEIGLIKFTIGYHTILDEGTRDEEVDKPKQEVQLSPEKDQQIMEYTHFITH